MEDGVKSWSPERCKEVLVAYKEAYVALIDAGIEICEAKPGACDIAVPGEYVTFLQLARATDIRGHINLMQFAMGMRNVIYMIDTLADALVEVL